MGPAAYGSCVMMMLSLSAVSQQALRGEGRTGEVCSAARRWWNSDDGRGIPSPGLNAIVVVVAVLGAAARASRRRWNDKWFASIKVKRSDRLRYDVVNLNRGKVLLQPERIVAYNWHHADALDPTRQVRPLLLIAERGFMALCSQHARAMMLVRGAARRACSKCQVHRRSGRGGGGGGESLRPCRDALPGSRLATCCPQVILDPDHGCPYVAHMLHLFGARETRQGGAKKLYTDPAIPTSWWLLDAARPPA